MSKIKKAVGYGCMAALLFFGIVPWVIGEQKPADGSERFHENKEDRAISYKINSYTSPETKHAQIAARKVPDGYKLAAQSERLELYMDNAMKSIMIKNRQSGYVWSSIPEEEGLQQERLNEEWHAALRSPFLVEYFDEQSMLQRGSYLSLESTTERVEQVPGGIKATYALQKLDVTFTMEVKLEDDALVVRLDDKDMAENGKAKLSSIQPLPFLGAVLKDEIPGYMLIPDGSGALIRFQETHPRYDQAYDGKVYGMDHAAEYSDLRSINEQPILMPVFGMVHGTGQNGFLGIIEDGKHTSRIIAYPSGVNTNYYWTSPKFVLRYAYYQPTSKNMGGFNTFQAERNHEDRQVRYIFHDGRDADYVGMAKTYRNYLKDLDILKPKSVSQENIPLHMELLGLEKEPGIIGNTMVNMTSFEEAEAMVNELMNQGVHNLSVVFRGWDEGGLNGNNPDKFPVAKELGGEKRLLELKKSLEEKGVPLFLFADYTSAYGKNDDFSPKADGIRTISNNVLSDTYYLWFDEESSSDLTVYFINPKLAAEMAKSDAERFDQMGIDALALGKTGSLLLSDHHPQNKMSRMQAAGEYEKLAGSLLGKMDHVGVYKPNDYLWKYSSQMFEMPLYSSQYMFSTDTVPFLQIALHGYVDYFAPSANFNANPQQYLLRMVEYGAYPSYKLTNEPSWKLKNTLSNDMFTSYFKDWKGEIASTYEKMNAVLKHVQDATIEQRNVLDYGVVEVVYSNGKKIIVNYRAKDISYENQTVPKMDFILAGGE
ncbi:DUF5696 domain-containing protein [Paenibacillus alkaliterrae]|uniref:DUF5696 domain-containing protein n=1 Tax=Paenibacillus alkaliterrae TaxID=320909 RepID=UPI001F3B4FDE|nr:DUF5696 domain-containing protein [Paenibacillus alkaliterrae]MCF2940920.1 DUF5696 domain-containing protein [Paenibacillus alkaliterrae]